MPPGHLPVRSYLAVPVKAAWGEVLGGLFFGHSAGRASSPSSTSGWRVGIAAWASVALENARLYVEAPGRPTGMKDEFLAVLSHELRTPLNAIVGYARLLRGGILTGDKATRGLETLERNATSLTQIVDDVLDVSRIVSGKIRLDVQPVELPLVVDNAVATVQPAADAKGVRVQTIVDPARRPGLGRSRSAAAGRVEPAVERGEVHAERRPRAGAARARELARRDRRSATPASGSAPSSCRYVFERFRQADARHARARPAASGLGLAIVRHIVEMHGGTVDASSAGEGKGATFRVRLPMMIVHPGAVGPRRASIRAPSGRAADRTSATCAGIRVLAVDDEPDALALLRVVLESGRRRGHDRRAPRRRRSTGSATVQAPRVWSSTSACRRWTASS